MTEKKYAVNLEHLVWIEAESPEEAIRQAPEEFAELIEEMGLDVDFAVVDSMEE